MFQLGKYYKRLKNIPRVVIGYLMKENFNEYSNLYRVNSYHKIKKEDFFQLA